MKPPVILLQQRDFGQKINATFDFVVQNFKPLISVLIYIAVPFNLLSLTMGMIVIGTLSPETNYFSKFSDLSFISPFYFLVLFLGTLSFVITNLAICGYIVEYEKGNNQITPSSVWIYVKKSLLNSFGVLFLAVLCILIGLIFIIIPGYYLIFCFSIIFMVIVRENNGVLNSLKRCIELVDSPWWSPIVGSILFLWLLFFDSVRQKVRNWWSTFLLMAIMLIIYYLFNLLLTLPSLLMGYAKGLHLISLQSSPLYIIGAIFANVVGTIVYSIIPITSAMQYYNFVAKKEGSSYLIHAIDNIGKADTARSDLREEEF